MHFHDIVIIPEVLIQFTAFTYLVLTTNIPDSEAYVLVFHSLHIEPWIETDNYQEKQEHNKFSTK